MPPSQLLTLPDTPDRATITQFIRGLDNPLLRTVALAGLPAMSDEQITELFGRAKQVIELFQAGRKEEAQAIVNLYVPDGPMRHIATGLFKTYFPD